MLKRKRQLRWGVFLVLAATAVLAGCGGGKAGTSAGPSESPKPSSTVGEDQKTSGTEPVTITVTTNIVGEPANVLQEIANQFMRDNPDIKVEFSAPGKEYENIMKVKMASNQMPDVFSTHGWAKIRYGNYLADLRGEPWVPQLDDAIKDAVTDENGKVYALPIDQDKSGPVYNAEILEKYGVSVPQTVDELMKAAETIKTKSNGTVVPIHIGGADSWPLGHFLDLMSTALLISPPNNYAKQLLDGTFDWKNYDPLPELLKQLQEKGYLNKDVLTAKYLDTAKAFAEGKVAFGFYGPFLIEEAKKINPNLKAGLMPIPAMVPGDAPTFAGGEKTTWGVWKDTKHPEAAKRFVAYYAKPENVSKVAAINALPPGLKGIPINAGSLTQDFEKYKDIRVFPYFDRVYLPNGMWDVMCKNAQDLLAGAITPREFSENMKKEFDRLRASNK